MCCEQTLILDLEISETQSAHSTAVDRSKMYDQIDTRPRPLDNGLKIDSCMEWESVGVTHACYRITAGMEFTRMLLVREV